MELTREVLAASLLNTYRVWHDVFMAGEETKLPLLARAEFRSRSEKYVLVKKAKLWAAENYEYVYLFSLPRLTEEIAQECVEYALRLGLAKVRPHKEHMYTYISVVFLADGVDPGAEQYVKSCKYYKSYRFSLHGWAELRVLAADIKKELVCTNKRGRDLRKLFKKVRGVCIKNMQTEQAQNLQKE